MRRDIDRRHQDLSQCLVHERLVVVPGVLVGELALSGEVTMLH